MEEVNMKTITLEDNNDYFVVKECDNYVYLANINNPKDICVRKLITDNNEEYLTVLDNDEELNKALVLFSKKD